MSYTLEARALWRNDRVAVYADQMPYLVDSVAHLPSGGTSVTYSSGETVEYEAEFEVLVID